MEFVDAPKALSLGILNEVVPAADVMSVVRDYARKILRCAPLAVRATKQCTLQGRRYASAEGAMRAQLEGEFPLVDTMMKSDDIREGLNAFMEKRKPQWQCR